MSDRMTVNEIADAAYELANISTIAQMDSQIAFYRSAMILNGSQLDDLYIHQQARAILKIREFAAMFDLPQSFAD